MKKGKRVKFLKVFSIIKCDKKINLKNLNKNVYIYIYFWYFLVDGFIYNMC